eukprot:scaffold18860_cov120-Isochrysis_galbana.AAC.2
MANNSMVRWSAWCVLRQLGEGQWTRSGRSAWTEIGTGVAAGAHSLEYGDRMPVAPVELVRCSHACRPRPNYSHLLARPNLGWLRLDPALLPSAVDDGILHVLDRHRLVHQPRHARTLARGRAHAASELGKVVGRGQVMVCLLPLVLEDVVVELGDQIVDRASGVSLQRGAGSRRGRVQGGGLVGGARARGYAAKADPRRAGLRIGAAKHRALTRHRAGALGTPPPPPACALLCVAPSQLMLYPPSGWQRRPAHLAEGSAAVHAARRLPLQLARLMHRVDLSVVEQPLRRWPVWFRLPLILDKATLLVERANRAVAALRLGHGRRLAQKLARRACASRAAPPRVEQPSARA